MITFTLAILIIFCIFMYGLMVMYYTYSDPDPEHIKWNPREWKEINL